MSDYQHILVAIDLSRNSEALCTRGARIAQRFDARLSLLHVVEYVPVEPMGEALLPTVQIQQDLAVAAREKLEKLALRCGLEGVTRHVRIGNTKSEIVRTAADIDADLIVLGAHERHGLAILVNRTEDTVLHAAPCDVLAVRLAG